MKIVFIVALFPTFFSALSAGNLNNAVVNCTLETPVNPQAISHLLQQTLDEDQSLKEYTFCLYKGIGFQKDDGTFNPAAMKDVAYKLKGDHDLDDFIDECAKNPTKNGADNSWKWLMCMRQKMKLEMFFYLSNLFWGFSLKDAIPI